MMVYAVIFIGYQPEASAITVINDTIMHRVRIPVTMTEERWMCVMEQTQCKPLLGVILCKQCNRFIAEQDTERVTVYYMDCKSHGCHEDAASEREVQYLEV